MIAVGDVGVASLLVDGERFLCSRAWKLPASERADSAHLVPSCIKTTDEGASCSYSTKRGSALCTPYGDVPNKGGPITRGLARFDRSRRHTHPPRLAVGAAEDRPVSATSRLRPSRPMRCGGSSSPSSSWEATPMITLSSFGSTARRPITLVPDGKDMSVCLRDRSTSTSRRSCLGLLG